MCRTAACLLLSFVLMAGSIAAQGVDPGTENLRHSWTFNDGTANDYIGGANGTLVGGATVTEGVLWIAEQDQWMEMSGDLIALQDYEAITLEAWYIPLAGANEEYTMLAYFGDVVDEAGADGYFMTSARGDDKSRTAITCGVYTNPWSGETGADGVEYDDGELHHMVSTLTEDEISLYIDGELMATTPLAETNGIWGISTNYAYLAKSGYTTDPEWIGDINEFNIYNKALSGDEVLYLWLEGPSEEVMAVETEEQLPGAYRLMQNYPNPFNPATTISFQLPKASKVRITVYDALGQERVQLVDGMMPAGDHTVHFDSRDLSSGHYLYRMDVDQRTYTRRMLLVR